ncbi:MAG: hypothetical protein WC951_06740 [Bacteroidales bacterium]|nr:hypothetical protein [Tenuifilaceae bacterium]
MRTVVKGFKLNEPEGSPFLSENGIYRLYRKRVSSIENLETLL